VSPLTRALLVGLFTLGLSNTSRQKLDQEITNASMPSICSQGYELIAWAIRRRMHDGVLTADRKIVRTLNGVTEQLTQEGYDAFSPQTYASARETFVGQLERIIRWYRRSPLQKRRPSDEQLINALDESIRRLSSYSRPQFSAVSVGRTTDDHASREMRQSFAAAPLPTVQTAVQKIFRADCSTVVYDNEEDFNSMHQGLVEGLIEYHITEGRNPETVLRQAFGQWAARMRFPPRLLRTLRDYMLQMERGGRLLRLSRIWRDTCQFVAAFVSEEPGGPCEEQMIARCVRHCFAEG
jgi:hypothetical protein